jgi:hypothetical protein
VWLQQVFLSWLWAFVRDIEWINNGCAWKIKCYIVIYAAISLGANPSGKPASPWMIPSRLYFQIHDARGRTKSVCGEECTLRLSVLYCLLKGHTLLFPKPENFCCKQSLPSRLLSNNCILICEDPACWLQRKSRGGRDGALAILHCVGLFRSDVSAWPLLLGRQKAWFNPISSAPSTWSSGDLWVQVNQCCLRSKIGKKV